MSELIENENVVLQFNKLKDLTSEEFAVSSMLSSLKVLGVKKVVPTDKLTEKEAKFINEYKYPQRLEQMLLLTIERQENKTHIFYQYALKEHGIKFD